MSTRKAGNLFKDALDRYQSDGRFQDIVETLGFAGVTAAGQALFTDMTPEEIAVSTLLGGGAAFAARPIFARAGYAIGRPIDKRFPNIEDHLGEVAALLSPFAPNSREIFKNELEEKLGKDSKWKDRVLAAAKAKTNQNYIRPDGTERGYVEGFLGFEGRKRGDNLAQAGVGILAPMVLNTTNQEEA